MKVKHGKTYMLRMINAALNYDLFFKIANHNFTVLAVDASYTEDYYTDIIVIAPGQSADVLFTANQPNGSYYMVASPYVVNFDDHDKNIARGTVIYDNAPPSSEPIMPTMTPADDTDTTFKFYGNVTGKVGAPHWVPVPVDVDEHMLVTIGFNLELCDSKNASNKSCAGELGHRTSASMNNESFAIPAGIKMSMLEAFYNNVSGVYTTDFPDKPPLMFDFTNLDNAYNTSLLFAPKSTKAKKLTFNSTVEIVFQNTALLLGQNHPMHLHGYDFHVLAQGFGNFDNDTDRANFNVNNPQLRNTVGVPLGGWAAIRFRADNPGIESLYVDCFSYFLFEIHKHSN